MIRRFLILFLFWLSALLLPAQQSTTEKLYKFAKNFEVSELPGPPAWVTDAKPLFRIAWLSDAHVMNKASRENFLLVLHQLRDEIHPDAIIVTGDNCGLPPRLLGKCPKEELNTRRHAWFRDTLEQELGVPQIVLHGDNWPLGYSQVFGSHHKSFDLGGFHFLQLALDAQAPSSNGCAVYDQKTLDWLQQDLQAHANMPTIVLQHEPAFPPCFLDAGKLEGIFNKHNAQHGSIIAMLSGHLHLDLQFQRKSWTQLICPALGTGHRQGFKLMDFHHDRIILTTYELNSEQQKYTLVPKWQRISIPEKVRLPENAAPTSPLTIQNLTEGAPVDCRLDKDLAQREEELTRGMMNAVLQGMFLAK